MTEWKTHVFISGLLMSIQHFQLIKECLSIVNKKWSTFARIIVTLSVMNLLYQGLKNCQSRMTLTTTAMAA